MPRRHLRPLAIGLAATLCSLIILTGTPSQAASVQLRWDAPTTHADGYKVYYASAVNTTTSPSTSVMR